MRPSFANAFQIIAGRVQLRFAKKFWASSACFLPRMVWVKIQTSLISMSAVSIELSERSEQISCEVRQRAQGRWCHCRRKPNPYPKTHAVLISVAETNDLSRRQVFHTHIVQVANVLGSDAVVAKFGDVRDGESIWPRAHLLEIFRLDAMVT